MMRIQKLIAIGFVLVCGNLLGSEFTRTPTVLFDNAADTSVELEPLFESTTDADEPLSNAELQQQIAELRKLIEPQNTEAESPPIDDGWEDTSTQGWTKTVGGRVLSEGVFWMDDVDGTQQNYFEIRQIRLELRGEGYGVLDYKVQMEFEPELDPTGNSIGGSVSMKDAFLGAKDVPLLGYLRVGHFKVHFSHDQILSRLNMTFMERFPMADPPGFTPGREVGVASYNHSEDLSRSFVFGGFIDSISETRMDRLDDNQGFVGAARYTWLPYYDEPSDGRYLLHFGLGAVYTDTQDGSGRFRQRPEIHEGDRLIDTGTMNADDYYVLGSEALFQWGSFYTFNEVMWATLNETGVGNRNLYSGYVETGWRLTGEHRTYRRESGEFRGMTPHSNFWWVDGCRGIGGWEVAARYSFVDFTDSPNQSEYDSWALALNWYWNKATKLQLNWINPTTSGAPFGDAFGSILSMRLAAYF